ncbi:MAG: glycoside hydrolase family 2 TIM barrel-domain containing protein [Lachnospiraceae bacterium]
MKKNQDFHSLESGGKKLNEQQRVQGRVVQDFSGLHWKMEKMRIGQGVAEGIHMLKNELSGNDFSWNKALVPGDVYTDLYLAGEIDDPHFGRNMAKIKWVQEYEWWYNYGFNIDATMVGKNLTLVFEGVDYSCDVWLNEEYLGHHEGMFSSFEFDVTDIVSHKQPSTPVNLLKIKLDPPPKNQKNIAGAKHNFAGDYLTGLIPFGIWRPVKLVATDKLKLDNYRAEYTVSDDKVVADFDVELTGFNNNMTGLTLKVDLKDGDTTAYSCSKEITVDMRTATESLSFELENPKLWWPYELGESFLYDLEISVCEGDVVLDTYTDKTGVRQVTMAMNPGFEEGEVENPWTFVINGKPMFLRSACWGGQPSFFYGRNSFEKYDFFLSKAREANINNLRIFGWHPPEVKEFYDLCDKYGITVWTNFTFATQEFRDDKEYIELVSHEAEMIVKERRNHPSVVMFMGGEEVYFSEAHVDSNNRNLMEHIGRVTNAYTNTPYGDASPLSSREGIRMGYAPKESMHANSHYYAAGAIFMEDYYPALDYCIIPELTAASSPSVESLKKFIPENELWPMGPSFGYHMGDIHVLQNLNYEVFGDVRMGSLEEFAESTQQAQGIIFQFSLEHYRRQKPHVSGVALCHFITNWPIIKWDIVDYYGKEKQSFGYVKRCYNPILPSLAFEKRRYLPGETLDGKFFVINDYYKTYDDVSYSYQVLDKNRNVVLEDTFTVNVAVNSSEAFADLAYTVGADMDDKFYITLTLTQNGEVISDNEYMFLVADQEAAKAHAKELYAQMHVGRAKYGKGYYRYSPELLEGL